MTTATTPTTTPGAHLAPAELRSWLETDDAPHVLDVRSPAEFENVHIPGSYNVPLETLREHRERLASHLDEHVVLVCRSGMRAEQGQSAFAAVGLPNVHVLDGGVSAWEAEGAPVERGASRWELERQVRLVAGGIVLAAGLGSIVVPGLRWIATGVGAGLVTAAATNTCAMGAALSKLPYNRGAASCDVDAVVAELAGTVSSAR